MTTREPPSMNFVQMGNGTLHLSRISVENWLFMLKSVCLSSLLQLLTRGLMCKWCIRTKKYVLFHINDQMYQERNERGNVRCLTPTSGLAYALFYSC